MELRHLRISASQARLGGRVTVPIDRERCATCGGSGYSCGYGGQTVGFCLTCQGTGSVRSDRTVAMILPPGVEDGTEVPVGDEGSLRWDGQREALVYVVHVDARWDQMDRHGTGQR